MRPPLPREPSYPEVARVNRSRPPLARRGRRAPRWLGQRRVEGGRGSCPGALDPCLGLKRCLVSLGPLSCPNSRRREGRSPGGATPTPPAPLASRAPLTRTRLSAASPRSLQPLPMFIRKFRRPPGDPSSRRPPGHPCAAPPSARPPTMARQPPPLSSTPTLNGGSRPRRP